MADIKREQFNLLVNVMMNLLSQLDIHPERDEVEAALTNVFCVE